jgi:hypothetical protein
MRADVIHQHHTWQPDLPLLDFVRLILSKKGMPDVEDPTEEGAELGDTPVLAYVNHGRWVADCVDPLCGGALCVDREYPYYLCVTCGNARQDGAWLRVTFPEDADAIEALLLRRPARDGWEATNRNWLPGTTLEELEAENTANGVG